MLAWFSNHAVAMGVQVANGRIAIVNDYLQGSVSDSILLTAIHSFNKYRLGAANSISLQCHTTDS
jgi:hypothetical protein